MRAIVLLICAVLFSATVSLAHAQDAPNWPRDGLRMPDMPLHDPWILAHEPSRTYYLYTSNIAPMTGVAGTGTMVYKSRDLANWNGPYNVFVVPDDAWATDGGWAPEVHEYRGRYFLFTTLHNRDTVLAEPPEVVETTYARGTIIAVSDSPDGPFEPVRNDPIPPDDLMTLDGTLYIDPEGRPWMVYAHEWIQARDGTMEAIPLQDDLSAAIDGVDPIVLFRASDAPWLPPDVVRDRLVTDGPELYRTGTGELLMLWSSYKGDYVQTLARSTTGDLRGPWEQLGTLVEGDSGHGMLFHTFEGQLMMVLHQPFRNARGKLYEMEDLGDRLDVVRKRDDLDGRLR